MFRGPVALLLLLLATASSLWGQTTSAAVYGIGTRITGDELLMKDVLHSPPGGDRGTIRFNYAISEPITYIEILSRENVLADVSFSYQNSLVEGSVQRFSTFSATTATFTVNPPPSLSNDVPTESAVAADDETELLAPLVEVPLAPIPPSAVNVPAEDERLTVEIAIYGFRDTMLNVNPSYILNRDQQFSGILQPVHNYQELDEENVSDYDDDVYDEGNEDGGINFTTAANGEIHIVTEDDDITSADKFIEIGERRDGDYLIYETSQVSPKGTQKPENHSVTFYYIDSNYITYIRFIILDHYIGKSQKPYIAPVGDYTHFSSKTVKAVITDYDTTSLFVQMLIYGYKPHDRPADYVPFLEQHQSHHYGSVLQHSGSTDVQISKAHELKQLLNAHEATEDSADAMMTDLVDADTQDYSLMPSSAVAAFSAPKALALTTASVFNDSVVKTWWMIALSLLRMVTAQPRA